MIVTQSLVLRGMGIVQKSIQESERAARSVPEHIIQIGRSIPEHIILLKRKVVVVSTDHES